MKITKCFLCLLILLAMMGRAIGQDENEPVQRTPLEDFERCNNWSRHYCQSGDHEQLVNKKLELWKAKGILITNKRVRLLAQKLRQNLKLPKAEENPQEQPERIPQR